MNRLLAKADSQKTADDRIGILESEFKDHTFETKTNAGESRVEILLTGVKDEAVKTGVNVLEPDVETMKRIAQGLYIPAKQAPRTEVGKQAATTAKEADKKATGSIAGTPGTGGGGGTAVGTK